MFRNEIKENNSDRLKEFNQGHNKHNVKVLTLDDFNLKGKTIFFKSGHELSNRSKNT